MRPALAWIDAVTACVRERCFHQLVSDLLLDPAFTRLVDYSRTRQRSRHHVVYEPPAGILVGRDVEKGENIEEFLPESLEEVGVLGRGRTRPGLTPVGFARTLDPESHKTFRSVFAAWIEPEIARRVAAGANVALLLPVRQALVVFPPRTAPERHRVLINDEVTVRAAVRPSYPASFSGGEAGDTMTISLRDMFDLHGFALEGVEMETEGFVWMRPEAKGWTMYFNFIPTSGFAGQIDINAKQQLMRAVQDAIAQEMLRGLLHGVFAEDVSVRTAMSADGWCPTPILLPEPWRQMCAAYQQADPAAAEASAVAAIGPGELDTMLASWLSVEPFASDKAFLERGLERYKAGDYISAVSVLLPRIEGLANRVRERRGIGARDSISQVFATLDRLASEAVRDGYLATHIREEFGALITNFLLVQFKPSAPSAGSARGRHAHAHGATGDPQYDQPYALKIILALDALHFVSR